MADILDPELQEKIDKRAGNIVAGLGLLPPRPKIPSVGYLPEEQGVLIPAIQRGVRALSEFKGPGGSPVPAQLSGIDRTVTGSSPVQTRFETDVPMGTPIYPESIINPAIVPTRTSESDIIPMEQGSYRIGAGPEQPMAANYWESPTVPGRGSLSVVPARSPGSYDNNPIITNPKTGERILTSHVNEKYDKEVERARLANAEEATRPYITEAQKSQDFRDRATLESSLATPIMKEAASQRLLQGIKSRGEAETEYVKSRGALELGTIAGRMKTTELAQKTAENDRKFQLDILKERMNQEKTIEGIQKVRAERLKIMTDLSGGTIQDQEKARAQIRFDDARTIRELSGTSDKMVESLQHKADTEINLDKKEKIYQEIERRQSLVRSYLNARNTLMSQYPGLVMPPFPIEGEKFRLTDPNKLYRFNFGTGKIEESP